MQQPDAAKYRRTAISACRPPPAPAHRPRARHRAQGARDEQAHRRDRLGRGAADRRSRLSRLRSLHRRLAGRSAAAIPIVLCVDVEPDQRSFGGDAPQWLGLEACLTRAAATRAELERRTGAPVALNWFIRADPQIELACGSANWILDTYAESWAELISAGDEIGLHIHAWRPDPGAGWIADHGDPAWVEHCTGLGLASYEAHFGSAPRAFRSGDRFLSSQLVAQLESAGVGVDLTVEPRSPGVERLVAEERSTGSIPDYSRAPEDPYEPRPGDFLHPAPAGRPEALTIVPLTAAANGSMATWADAREFADGLRSRAGAARRGISPSRSAAISASGTTPGNGCSSTLPAPTGRSPLAAADSFARIARRCRGRTGGSLTSAAK